MLNKGFSAVLNHVMYLILNLSLHYPHCIRVRSVSNPLQDFNSSAPSPLSKFTSTLRFILSSDDLLSAKVSPRNSDQSAEFTRLITQLKVRFFWV